MKPEYGADPIELRTEFDSPETSWSRRVAILYTLAYQASENKDHDVEESYLNAAIAISEEHDFKADLTDLKITLAKVTSNIFGRHNEALALLLEADKLVETLPSENNELRVRSRIASSNANVYEMLERNSEAVNQWDIHAEYSELLGNNPGVSYGAEKAADLLVDLGDLDGAESRALKARVIYVSASRPEDVADVDRILSRIMLRRGQAVQALALLIEVRDVERALKGRSTLETKLILGIAHIANGDFKEAEKLLLQARKGSFKAWPNNFKIGIEATDHLAGMLIDQGREAEAQELLNQAAAVASRVPQPDQTPSKFAEIEHLRDNNAPELAIRVAAELVQELSDAGEIQARWYAQLETVKCLWLLDDFSGIANLWDSVSHPSLDYQDDIVVQMKNLVIHGLFKVGRVDEALVLADQLLSDYRLGSNLQEKAYAHENKARILKVLNKSAQSKKFFDLAIEENMEAGNIERAIKLSKTYRTGTTGKGEPESY